VETPASILDLVVNLRAAKEVAAQCKANHPELRENYLTKLAEAIVSARCPFMDAPRMAHENIKAIPGSTSTAPPINLNAIAADLLDKNQQLTDLLHLCFAGCDRRKFQHRKSR
jgi:hypothetical protein